MFIYFQAAFYLFPRDGKDLSSAKIVHAVECSWVFILASQATMCFVIHAIPSFQNHFITDFILLSRILLFFVRGSGLENLHELTLILSMQSCVLWALMQEILANELTVARGSTAVSALDSSAHFLCSRSESVHHRNFFPVG